MLNPSFLSCDLVSFAKGSGFHLYVTSALVERCSHARLSRCAEEGVSGEAVVVQMLVGLGKESRSEISDCLSSELFVALQVVVMPRDVAGLVRGVAGVAACLEAGGEVIDLNFGGELLHKAQLCVVRLNLVPEFSSLLSLCICLFCRLDRSGRSLKSFPLKHCVTEVTSVDMSSLHNSFLHARRVLLCKLSYKGLAPDLLYLLAAHPLLIEHPLYIILILFQLHIKFLLQRYSIVYLSQHGERVLISRHWRIWNLDSSEQWTFALVFLHFMICFAFNWSCVPVLHFGRSSRATLIESENEIGRIDTLVLDGHEATGEGVVELVFFLFL